MKFEVIQAYLDIFNLKETIYYTETKTKQAHKDYFINSYTLDFLRFTEMEHLNLFHFGRQLTISQELKNLYHFKIPIFEGGGQNILQRL